VFVGQPSVEDTIAILRGLKERYEVHHGVRITDNAIVAAATLSQRYITDRFLPDKAVDLVHEAASRLRIEIDSLPQEIDEVERKIVQYQIELAALRKRKTASKERRAWVTKAARPRPVADDESAVAGRERDHRRPAGKKAELERPRSEADCGQRAGQGAVEGRRSNTARFPRWSGTTEFEKRLTEVRNAPKEEVDAEVSPRSSRNGPASPCHACSNRSASASLASRRSWANG
jgi:ATP-dependent Clp protease ATP-binding subunit ClpA